MNRADARLVAALTMLGAQLPALVDEITAGQLDQAERAELAVVFATLAGALDPQRLERNVPISPRRVEVRGMGADGAR